LSRAPSTRKRAALLLPALLGALWAARAGAAAASPPAAPRPTVAAVLADGGGYDQIGIASWYGAQHQGRRTASGARFDRKALSAAHGSLPLGTLVLVENLENGRRVALRITDRGPYVAGRIIDLSQAAAQLLDLERPGLGVVGIIVLPQPAALQQLARACSPAPLC
jgi:rare lipoprotein A